MTNKVIIFTDEVREEVSKRYWDEIAPTVVEIIEKRLPKECFDKYSKLLPYLKEYTLEKCLRICEEKQEYCNSGWTGSGGDNNPEKIFMTIIKNVSNMKAYEFIAYIKSNQSKNVHREAKIIGESLFKKLNRQYSLDYLLNE